MPRTLSKDAEDQIISGVKRAASMIDTEGLHPNAAIEKIARENRWGPELVKFASHAYNTGRQNAQLESATNALTKFADFPLADPDAINANIWPSKDKLASYAAPLPVSAEYKQPPTYLAKQAEARSLAKLRTTVKAAAAANMCKACGKSPCTCKTASFHDVAYQHQQLKTAVAKSRQATSNAYDSLMHSTAAVTDYFRTKLSADRLPFAEVELAAMAYHGAAGQKLMDMVYANSQLKEARISTKGVKFAGSPYDPNLEPYRSIGRCIRFAGEVIQKRAAEEAAYKSLERFVAFELLPRVGIEHKKASWDMVNGAQVETTYTTGNMAIYLPARRKEASAVPFVQAPIQSEPEVWSLLTGRGSQKQADGSPLSMIIPASVGSATKQLFENSMGGPKNPPQSPVDKAWLELEDPAHDSELRKIRTQAMMSDLMNDEVIGGYDPEHVMQTYNELSQLAPRSAQQPAVMRAALRRHLQGNVQPFETRDTLDTEKSLKDTTSDTPESRELQNAPKSILG